jgi:hypothetical protein
MVEAFWNLDSYSFGSIFEPELPTPYGSVNTLVY